MGISVSSKEGWAEGPVWGPAYELFPHDGITERERLAVPARVLIDNVTLAFAALFHAVARGTVDCAEQAIVGTPLRMIAYRVRSADDSETLHFEVRSRPSQAEDRERVLPASSHPANQPPL